MSIMSSMEACAAWVERERCERERQSILAAKGASIASGSSIQNSARCRGVLLFSARKVGPKLYTRPMAHAAASACNCADTDKCMGIPKKGGSGEAAAGDAAVGEGR